MFDAASARRAHRNISGRQRKLAARVRAPQTRRVCAAAAAVGLMSLAPSTSARTHTSPSRPVTVRLSINAPEVFSFADETKNHANALGLVQGTLHQAGFDARLRLSNGALVGPVRLFDGRGEIVGTLHLRFGAGGAYAGSLVASSGAGRYAHATGTLKLAGTTSSKVPGVAVFPGQMHGVLHVIPGRSPAPAHRAIHVDLRGEQTKLAFQGTPGRPYFAQLTAAGQTSLPRIGPGVLLVVTDIYANQDRPLTATFLGPDGTWTVRDSTLTSTNLSTVTPAHVIAGTGRYRHAHGTLSYTVPTSSSTGGVSSGLFISRLFGALHF